MHSSSTRVVARAGELRETARAIAGTSAATSIVIMTTRWAGLSSEASRGMKRHTGATTTTTTVITSAPRPTPCPLMRLRAGDVIADTYLLDERIAAGGTGEIWRAHHLRLRGCVVAIKVLLGTQRTREGFARFRRDAELIAQLRHANLVAIVDYNLLPDGRPYMVLEYLDGITLRRRLARGAVSLDAARSIVRQIGSALAAAHAIGVLHRDLKPENVMLVDDDPVLHPAGRVKLLDFGISRDARSGTPEYMAPEQVLGDPKALDARCDVYALGAIAVELLSGSGPFAPCTTLGNARAQRLSRVAPRLDLPPDLPPHVRPVLARALASDRAERWPDVASFVAALTGAPGGAPRFRLARGSEPGIVRPANIPALGGMGLGPPRRPLPPPHRRPAQPTITPPPARPTAKIDAPMSPRWATVALASLVTLFTAAMVIAAQA
jgi:serine/threonine-protein kinase